MNLSSTLLALVLLCFTCLGVQAGELRLDDRLTPLNAAGSLQRLDDPDGLLTPEQAAHAQGWRPLPAGLSAGFSHSTIWLKVPVTYVGNAPDPWILRLSNALLDDVRLYLPTGPGSWRESRAGENLPRALWQVRYRTAAFPLKFEQTGQQDILLRLQSKNALSVGVELSPQAIFADNTRREFLGYGLYFGFYLLLIIFHTAFWRITKVPESGWYLLYVMSCVWIEGLTIGLPQQLLGLSVGVSDPLLGVGIALSLPIGVTFAGRQLKLQALFPRSFRSLQGLTWLIGIGGAIVTLAGHYGTAAQVVQGTILLLIPIFVSLAVWLYWRGHAPARFYLLAFGVFYAGVVISFLRNLGYVPITFWTDHASAIGTLLHMALMSLHIINHYQQLKSAAERTQAEAAELALRQNERLEAEVQRRTQELREEIDQRQRLEVELREALTQQLSLQAQQRDFVAMVSHEFRTPLAVISTSAQQLARNLDAPLEKNQRRCVNIREAVGRLLALVDDYLDHDRMAETRPELQLSACNLPALLRSVECEFDPGRVQVECTLAEAHWQCDQGLLRVAVRNLLANADRHAPAHQPIAVRVGLDARDCLWLEVSNPGEPIPEDEQSRLFQKYYRGRQALVSPGAGLGLYLVKRIAQMHGGDVALLSAGGAQPVLFRLWLSPASGATPHNHAHASPSVAAMGWPAG